MKHRAHLHPDAGETLLLRLPVPASNLVMYSNAADNDYVGVTGTFLGTVAQVSGARRLDFSVPPGGVAKLQAALRRLRRVDLRASAAVGGPAGRLAGPYGLGHAGRAHRAG